MFGPHDPPPDDLDRTLVRLVAARIDAGTRAERDAAGAALLQLLAAASSCGDPCPGHRIPGTSRRAGTEAPAELAAQRGPRVDSLA